MGELCCNSFPLSRLSLVNMHHQVSRITDGFTCLNHLHQSLAMEKLSLQQGCIDRDTSFCRTADPSTSMKCESAVFESSAITRCFLTP